MTSNIEKKYKSIYQDMEFERKELFKALSEKLKIETVLYPGSNIHITPSFYFQHVIYVDIADNAAGFFADRDGVAGLIQKNKVYKQAPYFRFIHQDFTRPLPFKECAFDLLLALFAGGITKACNKYIKKGGFVLTNNHQNDAVDAANDHTLIPVALIAKQKGKYAFLEIDEYYFSELMQGGSGKMLKNSPRGGLKYIDNETFFLFQKTAE